MNRFLQHPALPGTAAVSGRYRHGPAARPVVEAELTQAQRQALAAYDTTATAARPTKPDAPAARRFQGWRVP